MENLISLFQAQIDDDTNETEVSPEIDPRCVEYALGVLKWIEGNYYSEKLLTKEE